MTEPRNLSDPRPRASDPGDRIQALDVLRGFALCGIVFINIYQTLGMRDLPAALGLFVQHRFFVIFSLLFGIGFAIFLERASARSDRPRLLLVRRFAFLACSAGCTTCSSRPRCCCPTPSAGWCSCCPSATPRPGSTWSPGWSC